MVETDEATARAEPRPRILVVDDNIMICRSIALLLSAAYDVRVADCATAARALLRDKDADVVITDFEMPGETGLELVRSLKPTHPATIAVLLTAHADLPQVQAAKRAREVFYLLVKPYLPESLLQWTQAAVSASRVRRSVRVMSARFPTG